MSKTLTRRSVIGAICAAAPIVTLCADNSAKPLSNDEQWILDWFRGAGTTERDAIQGLMHSLRRDDYPLPPGWWAEGEGNQLMTMNARTADKSRAFAESQRAWRAQQAAAAARKAVR